MNTTATRPSWLVVSLGALCIGAIVAAVLVVGPLSSSGATVTRTAKVADGVVQSTVSGSGTLQPATKVGVNFATGGTLTRVLVSVGEHVKDGQLLAEISPTSAESSLGSAETTLTGAEASYQGAIEGLTPAELREDAISAAQSRAAVVSAEESLKESRETAKSDAATAAATVAQDEASSRRTEQSATLEGTNQQDTVDEAISQVGADEQTFATARTQLEEAKALLAAERDKPNNEAKATSAEQKVSSGEATVKSDEAKVKQDNVSVVTAKNTQASAALRSQQSVESARNAVTAAKQSLASTKMKDRQSTVQAQASITSAEQALQSTLASNEAKQAPPTESTVVSAQDTVKSAQLSVENARRTLADTKLYAPTEGVVASIKDSVGEAVSGTASSSSESTSGGASASTSHGASTNSSASGTSGASATSSAGASTSHGASSGASETGASRSGTSSTGASGGVTGESGAAGSGVSPAGGAASATYSGGGSLHDIAAGASAASSSATTGASGAASESSTSSSSFIELVDLHGYQLVVPLSESEIANVHVGQPATVTVEALEGRKFAAHVVSLPVLSTSNSGVVSYDVTFQLDQVEAAMKPGMTATAEVVVKQAEGVNVPSSAISAGAVTVEQNGKDIRKRVVTGLTGNSTTIILSGLSAGEEVVLPTATTTTTRATTTGRGGFAGAGGLGGLGGGGGGALFRGGG